MARRKRQQKRANGEGSIYQRKIEKKDGSVFYRWEAKITLTRKKGKPVRKTITGKSQAEVLEKMDQLKRQRLDGILNQADLSVSELYEKWLEDKQGNLKARTLEIYQTQARLHICPHIGHVRLSKTNPMMLQNLVMHIAQNSGRTQANRVRQQLHSMFKKALQWQLIAINPAEAVSPLKQSKKEIKIWSAHEAARFLQSCKHHRLYALFYLVMSTGLRKGELLNLKWSDINNQKLAVMTSKTSKGRRLIRLAADVIEILDIHKGRLSNDFGREIFPEDYVFPSTQGTRIHPRNLDRTLAILYLNCKQAWANEIAAYIELHKGENEQLQPWKLLANNLETGKVFPRISMHTFRHMHASILIKANFTPLEVAERLGHTNPSFTLDVYGHIFRENHEEPTVSLRDFLPDDGGK